MEVCDMTHSHEVSTNVNDFVSMQPGFMHCPLKKLGGKC